MEFPKEPSSDVSTVLDLILFADDTSAFMSCKNLDYLAHRLNSEMSKLSIWFRENKFPLNLKKLCISYLDQAKLKTYKL